jgi:hypothetical protein
MLGVLAVIACLGDAGQNQPVLWADPGRVEAVDFTYGAGGEALAPQSPFQFIHEADGGTSPKVTVRDARGVEWRVKGGLEVRAETFVTRLVAAMGYYTETTYFLAHGKFENVGRLTRASGFVKPDGTFTYASFERNSPGAQFTSDQWTWSNSPFAGTRQLNGLKILVMLVSNWDNKDARDRYKGSNTSVIACGDGPARQRVFFVNDWGQTLGRWGYGGIFGRHSVWNCADFSAQTPLFVLGTRGNLVRFGYAGQHTDDFKYGITVEDVRWLMQYLGRVTGAQIRAGLLASGASRDEEDCFTKALRARIEQLRKVSTSNARGVTSPNALN